MQIITLEDKEDNTEMTSTTKAITENNRRKSQGNGQKITPNNLTLRDVD